MPNPFKRRSEKEKELITRILGISAYFSKLKRKKPPLFTIKPMPDGGELALLPGREHLRKALEKWPESKVVKEITKSVIIRHYRDGKRRRFEKPTRGTFIREIEVDGKKEKFVFKRTRKFLTLSKRDIDAYWLMYLESARRRPSARKEVRTAHAIRTELGIPWEMPIGYTKHKRNTYAIFKYDDIFQSPVLPKDSETAPIKRKLKEAGFRQAFDGLDRPPTEYEFLEPFDKTGHWARSASGKLKGFDSESFYRVKKRKKKE